MVHSTLHHPQDLGLEGTLLTDILYRNVAFVNLVDPISHDLLVNLARDLQCPKTVRLVGKDLRLGSLGDGGPESPGLEAKSLGPHSVCFEALAGHRPSLGCAASFSVFGWPATGASASWAGRLPRDSTVHQALRPRQEVYGDAECSDKCAGGPRLPASVPGPGENHPPPSTHSHFVGIPLGTSAHCFHKEVPPRIEWRLPPAASTLFPPCTPSAQNPALVAP